MFIVQKFGFEEGIPGTPYNKAVKAAQLYQDKLTPSVAAALSDEEALMSSNTVLGNLVRTMKDEGGDILAEADILAKARYFCSDVIFLSLGGAEFWMNCTH